MPLVRDGNEDSMTFTITTSAYAFGVMRVVDNGGGYGESVTVYGNSGTIYSQNYIPNFFGIIADELITSVFFKEGAYDGDDIGYDDIVIGNVSPVPSHHATAGSGLIGLAGARRKKKIVGCKFSSKKAEYLICFAFFICILW